MSVRRFSDQGFSIPLLSEFGTLIARAALAGFFLFLLALASQA